MMTKSTMITVKNQKVWCLAEVQVEGKETFLTFVNVNLPMIADARGLVNAWEMLNATGRIFGLYGFRIDPGRSDEYFGNPGILYRSGKEGIDLRFTEFVEVEGNFTHHLQNVQKALSRIVRAFSKDDATSISIEEETY